MLLFAKVAALLLGLVVVMVAASKFLTQSPKYPTSVLSLCRNMVLKASQSAVVAHQDSSPLMALHHSSEALTAAYLARDLLGPENASKLTGVNINNLIRVLEEQRDDIIRVITTLCDRLVPLAPTLPTTNWVNTNTTPNMPAQD